MANKEYKQLNCRDAGVDCEFLVRAETEDEVMKVVADHGCRVHGKCDFSPEMKDQVRSIMRSVSV